MESPPLEGLLDKLCSGDAAAAEEVFRAYEPYLRMVVRRQLPAQLRSKFDSSDIVQSVMITVPVGVLWMSPPLLAYPPEKVQFSNITAPSLRIPPLRVPKSRLRKVTVAPGKMCIMPEATKSATT